MPRRYNEEYHYRGCTIVPPVCKRGRRSKGTDHAGWEIHLPDGTPVEERPMTIRAAYALIQQHPQALPYNDRAHQYTSAHAARVAERRHRWYLAHKAEIVEKERQHRARVRARRLEYRESVKDRSKA